MVTSQNWQQRLVVDLYTLLPTDDYLPEKGVSTKAEFHIQNTEYRWPSWFQDDRHDLSTSWDDPATRLVSPRGMSQRTRRKRHVLERSVVLLCTGEGYLQVMESYSSNGTFVLKVILCDRSVDVLTSTWRYKGLTFCHLTFSFDLRPSHLCHLSDG